MHSPLPKPQRVVIKIGSALMKLGGKDIVARFAHDASRIRALGTEVVIVSSGAIALGLTVLGYPERPTLVQELQAAAAAGQFELMQLWHNAFRHYQTAVAQVLLTHADLASRERFLNARHALLELLRRGAIPIINENDSVATEEIKVGDNDSLSAQVASLIGADRLIILTTVDGLYTGNPETMPGAARIPRVDDADAVRHFANGTGNTGLGTGGMATKIEAARAAVKRAIPVVIASGRIDQVLWRIYEGEDIGTLFVPKVALQSRKHWIGFTLKSTGTLLVDNGAAVAVRDKGKSLLPSGIVAVEGQFNRGAMVEIQVADSKESIARGLVAYSSDELQRLIGHNSREIQDILGYINTKEIVHRDDMAVFNAAPSPRNPET